MQRLMCVQCIHICLNSQVQSVTSVGGGEFSSPVTVSLRESSDAPASGTPVVAITAIVIVVVILILGLIVAGLLVYICW